MNALQLRLGRPEFWQRAIYVPRSDPKPIQSGLMIGDRVRLVALTQSRYNGLRGTVISTTDCDQSRCCVNLTNVTGEDAPKLLKVKPANLEKLSEKSTRLVSKVRVLRHFAGAEIMNPEDMVQAFFCGSSCDDLHGAIKEFNQNKILSVLMGTLQQESSLFALKDAGDCLKMIMIKAQTFPANDSSRRHEPSLDRLWAADADSESESVIPRFQDWSACAKAHFPLVQSLTEEQLDEYYELACVERWGEGGVPGDGSRRPQQHSYKGRNCVQLRDLLTAFKSCEGCAGDGSQSFCFCMNRAVNADLVKHCHECGLCFYLQPVLAHTRTHSLVVSALAALARMCQRKRVTTRFAHRDTTGAPTATPIMAQDKGIKVSRSGGESRTVPALVWFHIGDGARKIGAGACPIPHGWTCQGSDSPALAYISLK